MPPVVPASQPVSEPHAPTAAEVLEQLRRLLASRQLRESQQLQAFLDFIVRETLEGRGEGLKEYLLGRRVFGRRPDYDPRHDGIVRVQATALRKRLEKYYAEDGVTDPVTIDVPRGGYLPGFRYPAVAKPPAAAVRPDVEILPEPAPPRAHSWGRERRAFLIGCFCTLSVGAGWLWLRAPAKPAAWAGSTGRLSDFPQLWRPFFKSGAPCVVAYGVPLFFSADGLYFRDVEVNVPEQAKEYRINRFAQAFQVVPQPTDDTYTGVGEVEGTHLVSNFLASAGVPVSVTNARSMGVSDLAGRNVIVVSSLRFQTLLGNLHLPRDFEFTGEKPETIRNRNPLPGEKPVYVYGAGAGVATSYALVSLWPAPDGERRILHIGGVHTWSTQAATQFLLDRDQLRKLAAGFDKDKTTGVRGAVSPFFQILLRVEGRGNHSKSVEYVTHHYLHGS